MTVKDLIEDLEMLPEETQVYFAEQHGISDIGTGNLNPFKIRKSRFGGLDLYVDDGLGDHGLISAEWVPLDEYCAFLIDKEDGKVH